MKGVVNWPVTFANGRLNITAPTKMSKINELKINLAGDFINQRRTLSTPVILIFSLT